MYVEGAEAGLSDDDSLGAAKFLTDEFTPDLVEAAYPKQVASGPLGKTFFSKMPSILPPSLQY
jgi:hypothetical protein